MKLSLRQKSNLSLGVMLSSIPISWLSAAIDWPVGFGLGFVPLIIGGILGMRWMRCPHCGRPLYARGFRPFCSECGKEIDYDEK